MKKYLSVLKISLNQELIYKTSFLMWRMRNLVQITVFYFLWTSVFETNMNLGFSYSYNSIMSYMFLLVILRALILSSKSADVSGIISSGDLSNYLLRPINFFKYWISRDFANKFLNIIFSSIEVAILFLIFKPSIFIQTDIVQIMYFVLFVLIAMLIYFQINMLTSFVPFWIPEMGWGAHFFVNAIIVEFFSGSMFPLDILPNLFFDVLKYTPFPYLLYVPIKAYLGHFSLLEIGQMLIISFIWLVVLRLFLIKVWKSGLKVYEGVGR